MDSALCDLLWEGFIVESLTHNDSSLIVSLTPSAASALRCGSCKMQCYHVHDRTMRTIRDRTIGEYDVQLKVVVRRLKCCSCGTRPEYIPWLSRYSRITDRLHTQVESLCRVLPIKHIADITGLHWHTIKTIDRLRLSREIKPPNWAQVSRLMMDEFAIYKGHRYATVIADADTKQILWVGLGRSREQIRPFFEILGEHCSQITAVAMDMNTAFDLEVQMHCPNAEIVYDLFHVVAKYGREVIDRVRVDEANRLKEDKKARKWVKRSRWILLKNAENLSAEQANYLEEVLSRNQALTVVYILKAQLKALWYCDSKDEARRLCSIWYQQVEESGIKVLEQFARKLKPYLHGIISSATHRLHTSGLEGMNNKIKVMKRMGYGYRDTEYFFLKVKAAFPGIAR